ncbi:MAG: serine/threonine protein kinase [Planctomycetaceae bacterium]|nr:serine/threonine protein kinase [Planctomycetaceae bacterium]|tara:strand:+ start:172 stop:1686 length:1515 start_codon:yes stop_codon:yes gene_type:complete
MSDITVEKLSRFSVETGVLTSQQAENTLSEAGGIEAGLEAYISVLTRKELITNWQLDRLSKGHRDGYFYGKHKVLYLVGAGTFARVYRCVDTETDRVRAVKVLRHRYGDDLEVTEQFMREARLVMPLRHPNIIPVHEVDSYRGRYYMTMDFIEGQNLRDFVKLRKHMELGETIKLIKGICNGLQYAYNEGITHRDLKLSNVLVSSKGQAKLADFGLATMVSTDDKKKKADGPNPRSIDYAGLERATKVPRNDIRSDIFFVGCMFYHLLAGHPPLIETRDRIQRLNISRYRDIPPIGRYVSGLPHNVIGIVNKLTAFDPEKRYPNYELLMADLDKVEQADGVLLDRRKVKKTEDGKQQESTSRKRGVIQQEGEGKTVLLVDSRQKMQELLRAQLGKRGYRVLIVSNAERGVQRLQEGVGEFDCAIFCTGELGEDALTAFNQLREDYRTESIPAVIIVEKTQTSFASRASLSSLHGLLQMPIKVRQLREALVKLINRKESLESAEQ